MYPHVFLSRVVFISRLLCNHIKMLRKTSPTKSQERLMVQILLSFLHKSITQWAKYSLSWSKKVWFAYWMSAVLNSSQNMEEQCIMSFTQEKVYLKIVCLSSYCGQCDFFLSDQQKSLINNNILLYFLFHYLSVYPAREFCGLICGFSEKILAHSSGTI